MALGRAFPIPMKYFNLAADRLPDSPLTHPVVITDMMGRNLDDAIKHAPAGNHGPWREATAEDIAEHNAFWGVK